MAESGQWITRMAPGDTSKILDYTIIQLCIRTKNYLKQWCDYAYKLKQIYSNGVIMHTNKK